jgi:hypothetical protein
VLSLILAVLGLRRFSQQTSLPPASQSALHDPVVRCSTPRVDMPAEGESMTPRDSRESCALLDPRDNRRDGNKVDGQTREPTEHCDGFCANLCRYLGGVGSRDDSAQGYKERVGLELVQVSKGKQELSSAPARRQRLQRSSDRHLIPLTWQHPDLPSGPKWRTST